MRGNVLYLLQESRGSRSVKEGLPMPYKDQIDPELRGIAKNIPYNRAIIRCANLFQAVSFRATAIPKGIAHRRCTVKGYQGLKVGVDIFEPSGAKEKLPCLIDVHGGAFSYKASAYHKKLACTYAMGAKCRVFLPDYHLTPKYPYPAAYEDVLALYQSVLADSGALGIDRERIGLAGDSAGAAIAALICARYEQEGLQRPCLQMLVYPLTDASMRTASMRRFSDTPLWNAKNNKRMWAYYCKGLTAEEAYAASPMHGSLPQAIPDTYIETAEYDCLHDEGVLYGAKLREAGATVELHETRGTMHGYDFAFHSKIATRNIEKRLSFLDKGFHHEK